MPVDAGVDIAVIQAGLQVVQAVSSSVALYSQGQMTQQDLAKAWAAAGVDVDYAVGVWNASKGAS